MCADGGGPLGAGPRGPRPADAEVAPLLDELLRNAERALAEERAEAARQRVAPAGALPDPTLSFDYQNGGGRALPGQNDDTFAGVTATQSFPLPPKRHLAREAMHKDAERSATRIRRVELSLEAALRTALADLLLARELIEVLDAQRAAWGRLEEALRVRYAAGLSMQPEILRAQAEKARLLPMRAHEEGNVVAAIAKLNRLLGRPLGAGFPTPRRLSDVVPVGREPFTIPALSDLVALAEAKSPEIAEARLMAEAAEARLKRARLERRPDLFFSSAYQNRSATMPPMWAISAGLTLQIYSATRQRPMILEAEAEVRAATTAVAAIQSAVRVNIETNHAELAAAIREAEPYPSAILVQDRLAVESTLASYETGRTPFASVLDAMRAEWEDRKSYLDRLVHVLWHDATLHELVPAPPAGGVPSL